MPLVTGPETDRPASDVVAQFTPLLAFLTRRAEETLRLANDR
jgi:hypothetical protein